MSEQEGIAATDAGRAALGFGLAGVLTIVFCTLACMTWGSWGTPNVDAGTAVYRVMVLSQGGVLYHDIHSPYGPLADYAMAAVLAIFGPHLTVVYVAGLALLIVQSWLLWRIGRHFLSEIETAATVALFWTLYGFDSGLFNWILPNTFSSTFAVLFSSAVVLSMVKYARAPSSRHLIIASLATGLAGTSKIEFGAAAFGTMLMTIATTKPSDRSLIRDILLASMPGGLLALLVFLGAMSRGVGFDELIFDNLYRVRSFGAVSKYRDNALLPIFPLLGPAALHYALELPIRAFLVDLAIRRARELSWISFLLIALAGVGLLVPFLPFYPRNVDFERPYLILSQFGWVTVVWATLLVVCWYQLRAGSRTSAACALFVVAAYSLLTTIRWNFHVAWAPFYATFAPLLVTVCVRWTTRMMLGRTPVVGVAAVVAIGALCGALHNQKYVSHERIALDYPRGVILGRPRIANPMKRVIDHVRANSEVEDYVAVVPEEHFINFLAERRHPSRDPGIGPGWLANEDDVNAYLEELDQRETKFIVVSKRRFLGMGAGAIPSYVPELMAYIGERYTEDLRIPYFTVYRRVGSSHSR